MSMSTLAPLTDQEFARFQQFIREAAGIALALNFAANPYAAYEIMSWLLGSLADKSWAQFWLVLPFVLAGGALLALTGRGLDALALGEAQARGLGINLTLLAALVVGGTALSVGAATAVTGAIGFIGLVAPHLMRPLIGYDPGRLLVPSALTGAALLLAADIAVRIIPSTSDVKVGVLTALIGVPFFLYLIVRERRALSGSVA